MASRSVGGIVALAAFLSGEVVFLTCATSEWPAGWYVAPAVFHPVIVAEVALAALCTFAILVGVRHDRGVIQRVVIGGAVASFLLVVQWAVLLILRSELSFRYVLRNDVRSVFEPTYGFIVLGLLACVMYGMRTATQEAAGTVALDYASVLALWSIEGPLLHSVAHISVGPIAAGAIAIGVGLLLRFRPANPAVSWLRRFVTSVAIVAVVAVGVLLLKDEMKQELVIVAAAALGTFLCVNLSTTPGTPDGDRAQHVASSHAARRGDSVTNDAECRSGVRRGDSRAQRRSGCAWTATSWSWPRVAGLFVLTALLAVLVASAVAPAIVRGYLEMMGVVRSINPRHYSGVHTFHTRYDLAIVAAATLTGFVWRGLRTARPRGEMPVQIPI